MKRNNKIPTIRINRTNIGNIFRKIGYAKSTISEGFIRTYPTDTLVRHAMKFCGFTTVEKFCNSPRYDGGGVGVVDSNGVECIMFIFYDTEGNRSLIDKMMNTYGYFKSNEEPYYGDYLRIEYEPKFEKSVNDAILKNGFVFHVTSTSKIEKIKEIGLSPRTSGIKFKHPDRIYFFYKDPGDGILKMFLNEKIESDGNYAFGKEYVVDFTLLKVNVMEIADKINFYNDPNMEYGLYTTDNIKPEYISIERRLKYKVLKDAEHGVYDSETLNMYGQKIWR